MDSENNFLNKNMYNINKKNKLTPFNNEKKLCIEALNGNVKSRNELITSNMGLVIKIANMYRNMGVDMEDLVSEGNKGLITAITKFNPVKDNKFSTYAYFWIKQAIIASIKSNNQWSCLSFNNVLNYDEYGDKDLVVNMNEFEDNTDSKNIKDIIRKIDGLPKRDCSIIKHYFGISGFSELNTIELSQKFNISTMRVSNIIENSIRKIRCEILENI